MTRKLQRNTRRKLRANRLDQEARRKDEVKEDRKLARTLRKGAAVDKMLAGVAGVS